MKKTIISIAVLSFLTTNLFANHHMEDKKEHYKKDRTEWKKQQKEMFKNGSLEDVKKMINARLDKREEKLNNRLNELSKVRTCIQNASSKQELRQCKPKRKNHKHSYKKNRE